MTLDGISVGFEEWHSFARPFFDVIPKGRSEAFRAHAKSGKVGRLVVSEVNFGAAVFDRDPGRMRDFDSEFLLLETYESGNNRGRSGDLVTRLDAGSVHIFDMAQPWRSETSEVACRSVVIPYSLIGYDPSRQPAYVRLPANSPRNAMVLSAMSALSDVGERLEPEDGDALAESFCALVRRLMFNQREQDAKEGASDAFLRQFIDEHLADPDLGPERLCDALGRSRPALYRMLSKEGGVRAYITARRLDRCFDELIQSSPERGRVRNVAERWGFFDAKSFNRAFRAQFGIAPSDCLDGPIDIDRNMAARHPVNDWMRQL